MGKVYVFLATGFEEIEALTVVDILRRGNIETETVSVMGEKTVDGSHKIPVIADKLLNEADFDSADMLVLPGGLAGTKNLEACELLMKQVDSFIASGKTVGAICAAPTILGHRGHLQGRKAICYPGLEGELAGAEVASKPAVKDGNIITGRGMGCSVAFALLILEHLTDKETADAMAKKVVYQR